MPSMIPGRAVSGSPGPMPEEKKDAAMYLEDVLGALEEEEVASAAASSSAGPCVTPG